MKGIPLRVLIAVSVILIVVLIGLVIHKKMAQGEGFVPFTQDQNKYTLAQRDLYQNRMNRSVPTTKGLDNEMNNLSKALFNVDTYLNTNFIPERIPFGSEEDPMPGFRNRDEKECKPIAQPRFLPPQTKNPPTSCGWWYRNDDNAMSTAALGTAQGPIEVERIKKSHPGGEWVWDLVKAQKLEDAKKCRRIRSCETADFFPEECGFCVSSNQGIPTTKSGEAKYPKDPNLSCGSKIVRNVDNCPRPDPIPRIVTMKDGSILRSGDIQPNGKPLPFAPPPRLICDPNPSTGKLTLDCLIMLAKTTGFSEDGILLKILSGDAEGYYYRLGENNDTFHLVLRIMEQEGKYKLDGALFGDGSMSKAQITYGYNQIMFFSRTSNIPRVKNASRWLVRGTKFDPCEYDLGQVGPYDGICLQRVALEAGCQRDGYKFPNASTYFDFAPMRWSMVNQFFKNMFEATQNNDPKIQYKATLDCLGITVAQHVAAACEPAHKIIAEDPAKTEMQKAIAKIAQNRALADAAKSVAQQSLAPPPAAAPGGASINVPRAKPPVATFNAPPGQVKVPPPGIVAPAPLPVPAPRPSPAVSAPPVSKAAVAMASFTPASSGAALPVVKPKPVPISSPIVQNNPAVQAAKANLEALRIEVKKITSPVQKEQAAVKLAEASKQVATITQITKTVLSSPPPVITPPKSELAKGVEVLWYGWNFDSKFTSADYTPMPFYGRKVHSSAPFIPSFNTGGGDFNPYRMNDRMAMHIRANLVNKERENKRMYVVTDDGLLIKVDNKVVLNKWWDQGPTGYQTDNFMVDVKPTPLDIFWYENGGGATFMPKLIDGKGKQQEIGPSDVTERVPSDYPLARWDFYLTAEFERNKVLASSTSGTTIGLIGGKTALIFDGRNPNVRITNPVRGSAFRSFAMMIYCTGVPGGYNRLFALRGGNFNDWGPSVAIEGGLTGDGTVWMGLKWPGRGYENLWLTSPRGAVKFNVWTHVAYVYDRDLKGGCIFVNGKEIARTRNNNANGDYFNNMWYEGSCIGHSHYPFNAAQSGQPYRGGIAWAHWFDYSLSPQDAQKDMRNGYTDVKYYVEDPKLIPRAPTGGGNKVTFFTGCNYTGRSVEIGIGDYPFSKFMATGFPNDALQAVRVPNGLKVTLWEHDIGGGRPMVLTADTPCLQSLNYGNTTSSCVISSTAAPPPSLYSHKGCWGDSGNRALPEFKGNVKTIDECAQIAKKGGFKTFGLQYYGQCFMGNNTNWNRYGPRDNKSCGLLGSGWTNQVYQFN